MAFAYPSLAPRRRMLAPAAPRDMLSRITDESLGGAMPSRVTDAAGGGPMRALAPAPVRATSTPGFGHRAFAPAGGAGLAPAGAGGGEPDSVQGFLAQLLRGGNAAGAFGPDFLRRALRSRALRTAGNARHRAGTATRLYGADPMGARQAMLDAEIASGSDLSNALNDADLQGLSGWRDMLMSILTGERGAERQFQEEEHHAQMNRAPGGLGGFLGQVGGGLLGRAFSRGGGGDEDED